MKVNNRNKATISLTAATAGFLLCYPYQHTFWGALFSSGFSAAMVGGLADWYAVTALFRKPLQIPYRTAIIPKNRERIFSAITVMVEEELLTADNIRETLQKTAITKLIMHYAAQAETRQVLYSIAGRFAQEAVEAIDAAKISTAVDILLTANKDQVKVAPLAGQALSWSLTTGFADRLIDLGITELQQMVREKYMTELIANLYSSALATYAAGQKQRKLAGWLLENLLSLDPVTVAGMMQQQIDGMLKEMMNPDHHLRLRLTGWLGKLVEDLQTDPLLENKIKTALRPLAVNLVNQLAELPANHPEAATLWPQWLARKAVKLTKNLMADADRQARSDALVIDWLVHWFTQNHSEIGRLVGAYLNRFSNEELVEYIEEKVIDDLQMIRINGSIVGGLVGIVLFLIAYAAGVGP